MEENRNEVEEDIHEVKCKLPQGGCIREEVEEECTSSFLVGDLQITAQGFGSCMGGETYFGSDPKEIYISYLQSPSEPQNEEENKATPLRCEPKYLVEEQATKVYVQEEDEVKNMHDEVSDFFQQLCSPATI